MSENESISSAIVQAIMRMMIGCGWFCLPQMEGTFGCHVWFFSVFLSFLDLIMTSSERDAFPKFPIDSSLIKVDNTNESSAEAPLSSVDKTQIFISFCLIKINSFQSGMNASIKVKQNFKSCLIFLGKDLTVGLKKQGKEEPKSASRESARN